MRTPEETRKLTLALVLSIAALALWHFGWQAPQQRIAFEKKRQELELAQKETAKLAPAAVVNAVPAQPARDQILENSRRISIRNDHLKGSLSLRGARFDDLVLLGYQESLEPDSSHVTLLSPSGDQHTYFAQFGWLSASSALVLPDNNTEWQSDGENLTPSSPVTLRWDNGQGILFTKKISVDQDNMFTIETSVHNKSASAASLADYGLISRTYTQHGQAFAILHEGPIGISEGALVEYDYSKLKDDGSVSQNKSSGWLGISDKYWLTAIIPADKQFKANYSYYDLSGQDRFQSDYVGNAITVAAGETHTSTIRFFAGAKRLSQLDAYAKQYSIPLFDRAVDFGRLYFITKPLFELLHYFYTLIGNFGLAIMLLTVVVKIALFPLANKSYHSMAHMRELVPQMNILKERYADDRIKLNQEIMALYKREKVNPAAGCLPMLIQIPIFFALYKVLFVTIEMRQAPFYGWIHDLSLPDPTNMFTLFGLVAWTPPSFLHIGVLPLVMAVTMIIQQKLNPKPADPVQAQVIALMPYIFVFMFAGFPAGLVLYWAWNNTLSVMQQWVITYRHDLKVKQRKLAHV